MTKHTASIDSHVWQRIALQGNGWVFTPSDFADLGSRTAVALALMRYVAAGQIRQLSRGLYDWPRQHPLLGSLWPEIPRVAQALERKDGLRLQPAGACAANMLGLSEQVPAQVVYLTDGPSREVAVGPTHISLKRTTPKNMACAGSLSGLLIQALRFLGKDHVTAERIARLRSALPAEERVKLKTDLAYASAWMRPWLLEVARP